MTAAAKRDLLSMADLDQNLSAILARALAMKRARREGELSPTRPGRTVAMIFEKPSTRTRTSFEVATNDLGGHAIYLSARDLQLGRGETISDTARVLSRYVDAVVYRAFRHADVAELARAASIPVINALDDLEHPCQVVADLLTLYELWNGRFAGHRFVYVGDGNNVCNSLLLGCALVGLNFTGAVPKGYRSPPELVARAEKFARASGGSLRFVESPREAAKGAEVLYTDVWVSMGDESQEKERTAAFAGYTIDEELLALAAPGCRVMHDLPAHRGLEITDAVIDGPQSVVWDQAENRLHAQKALLEWLLPEGRPS